MSVLSLLVTFLRRPRFMLAVFAMARVRAARRVRRKKPP